MNRIIVLTTTLAFCLGLSACNTVRGIGQDVKKAGEVIEGAAKK